MKTATKWILVSVGGIALVSTLAFGGSRYGHHDPGAFAERFMERVTEKLDLNTAQTEKLHGIKDAITEAREKLRENRKDKRDEVLALLEQPTLDQEKAMALLTERGDAMKEQAPKVIAAIADFYDSLTPEQQQTLRETIKKRMEWREKCGSGWSEGDPKNGAIDLDSDKSFVSNKDRHFHRSDAETTFYM